MPPNIDFNFLHECQSHAASKLHSALHTPISEKSIKTQGVRRASILKKGNVKITLPRPNNPERIQSSKDVTKQVIVVTQPKHIDEGIPHLKNNVALPD